MTPEPQDLISSLISGGLVTAMARLVLQKTFAKLEAIASSLQVVQQQLAVLTTRLENHEAATNLVHQHDRKIAALEAIIHGGNWPAAGALPLSTKYRGDI